MTCVPDPDELAQVEENLRAEVKRRLHVTGTSPAEQLRQVVAAVQAWPEWLKRVAGIPKERRP